MSYEITPQETSGLFKVKNLLNGNIYDVDIHTPFCNECLAWKFTKNNKKGKKSKLCKHIKMCRGIKISECVILKIPKRINYSYLAHTGMPIFISRIL